MVGVRIAIIVVHPVVVMFLNGNFYHSFSIDIFLKNTCSKLIEVANSIR